MRSAAYSIFTTLLLLAPISAVPLMAIFGVPQFTPVVASPLDETEDDDWDRPARKSSRSKVPETLPDEEIDPFEDDTLDWDAPTKDRLKPMKKPCTPARGHLAGDKIASHSPTEREPEAISKASSKPPRRPMASPDESEEVIEFASSESSDAAGSDVGFADFSQEINEAPAKNPVKSTGAIPSYRRTRSGDESDRAGDRTPDRFRRSTPSSQPLTWSKAVVRLNELGIRNFKLEPGVRPGEFTFTCSYTPTNSPHVTRRFEAEADDPLKAVAHVLTQVERWAQQRDAASKRTAETPREVN